MASIPINFYHHHHHHHHAPHHDLEKLKIFDFLTDFFMAMASFCTGNSAELSNQFCHISVLKYGNSGCAAKNVKVCGLGEGDCDTDAQCAPGFLFVYFGISHNEERM